MPPVRKKTSRVVTRARRSAVAIPREFSEPRWKQWVSAPREVGQEVGLFIVVSFFLTMGLGIQALAAVPYAVTSLEPTYRWFVSEDQYRLRIPTTAQVNTAISGVTKIRYRGETVTVTAGFDVPQASLFPDATILYTLHDIPAVRYHDVDPASGLPIDRVVITGPSGMHYELRGSGPLFESLAPTFELTPSQ